MNPIYALTIVLIIYAAGDFVAQITKAKLPSSVVRGAICLIGLWIGLIPQDTFKNSTIGDFGMMAVTLMIVMLGTTIDTPELKRQAKTIVVCLIGVVLSSASIILIAPLLINPQYAYVGSAVYAGGSAVILMMTSVLKPMGLTEVIGFFTVLGMAQSFFGQPVCSFFLRRFARGFLADPAQVKQWAQMDESQIKAQQKRKILSLPQSLNRVPIVLMKVGMVACLAAFLSSLSGGRIHAFVLSIVLGWICVETGFLEKGTLQKTNSAGLITFLAACVLFSNYVGVSPSIFLSYIIPILVIMGLGILSSAIAGFFLSKLVKLPSGLAIALVLTCTFGFPNTMILTDDVCDAMAKTEEERRALYNVLMPKMLVAGFITVTIASMFIGSFVIATFFS